MKIIQPIENLPLEDYLALEARMVETVSEPTLFIAPRTAFVSCSARVGEDASMPTAET